MKRIEGEGGQRVYSIFDDPTIIDDMTVQKGQTLINI